MQDMVQTDAQLSAVRSAFIDPTDMDLRFPPYFMQFVVPSGGAKLPVRLWLAQGAGAKGIVIITPPMGGNDALNSMIVPLNNAGIHAISFRPRGVRDPAFDYSMTQTMDDMHAIIAWIVANSDPHAKAPLDGPTYRFDPERVALFGMSGGGGNGSVSAVGESRFANYAVGVATGNFGIQMSPEYFVKNQKMFDDVKAATHGRSDYERWLRAMTPADVARVNIQDNAAKLVDKHIILLGGSQDKVSPINDGHIPNAKALRDAGVKDLTALVLETDHGFTTKRWSLARVTISWLKHQGF